MKKKIYIHIGAHKTGTSAIQTFLSLNREMLKTKGFLYPGMERAHHSIAGEFRRFSLSQITNNPKSSTLTYFDEINKSNLDNIILSSEIFECLHSSVESLKAFIDDKFEVKIIFYVRRQDEKIESMYNSSIKNPKIRSKISFPDFISGKSDTTQNDSFCLSQCCEEFGDLDYYSVLLPWERAFGKKNIIVRCYEKEQLLNGIFQDFLEVMGIVFDEKFQIPNERINPSLNWDVIEMLRLCHIQSNEDIRFHMFLLKNLAVINRDDKEKNQRLLSPQQRCDIIIKYEESNAKVAREYLGRDDGRLFYTPLPRPDDLWEQYEGLTLEKVVQILTQMMFNQDIKFQREIRAIRKQESEMKNGRNIFNIFGYVKQGIKNWLC